MSSIPLNSLVEIDLSSYKMRFMPCESCRKTTSHSFCFKSRYLGKIYCLRLHWIETSTLISVRNPEGAKFTIEESPA